MGKNTQLGIADPEGMLQLGLGALMLDLDAAWMGMQTGSLKVGLQ